MKGSNGYEPIPDVKVKDEPPKSYKESAQDRYPEANASEAELLGLLDDIIADPSVYVDLPQLKKDELDISTTFWGFLCALTLPTAIFLISAGLALWIAMDAVPAFVARFIRFFPFGAAILGFLGSIPAILARFRVQATIVESLVGTTRPVAQETVQNVVLSVAQKVDVVKMRLNLVVDSMRPKFSRANAARDDLKAMDPSMIIPDPEALERELEGAKDEVSDSITFVEKSFPVTPWIPAHLLTAQLFQRREANKVLFRFLILLLLGVLLLSLWFPMGVSVPPESESEFFRSVLKRIGKIFKSKDIKADATSIAEDMGVMLSDAWPAPLVFVLAVYVMVILQLVVVFRKTSATATATIVNNVRSSVSVKTNHVLTQQGIIFLCQDILEIRMGRVKSKLLELIHQLYKIDMLMSLTGVASSPSPSKSPKKSPVSSPTGRRVGSGLFRKYT